MEKQPVNNLVELIGSEFLRGWDANEYTTKNDMKFILNKYKCVMKN